MKKITKKAKRRMFFLTIILISIVGILVYNISNYWVQIFINIKKNNELTAEYNKLLERENILQSEVKKLEDPNYVAKYARENYLFSRDGEKIIRIID